MYAFLSSLLKPQTNPKSSAVDIVMSDQPGTSAPKLAAPGAGTADGSDATADRADSSRVDEDMDISFTFRPMDVDAAEFADAGFASADDFPAGHFDEPAEEEELAESIVAGPATHPTNDTIEATLATVKKQIQDLRANDAARRLDIDEIRRAGQVANTRLDDTDIKMKDLEATYKALSLQQDQSKVLLNNVVTGMSDFLRYFTDIQSSGSPASKFPPFQYLPHSPSATSNMATFTNSPSYCQLAQELFPDVFSTLSNQASTGDFNSPSRAGTSRTPVSRQRGPLSKQATSILPGARRTVSSALPQIKRLSGAHANHPRAVSAMVTRSQSSHTGKGKEKMDASKVADKDDEDNQDEIVDDLDADGEEDDDMENSQSQDE
jgi:hypothetical protein